MKALIVLALIVVVMMAFGWMNFRSTNDTTTISIETKKIEHDTSRAIEAGKEAIRDAGRSAVRPVETN